jgi:hypothetical protein
MELREREEGHLAVEVALHLVALFLGDGVPFVDSDDHCATGLEHVPGEMRVLFGDRVFRVSSSTTTLASSMACSVLITENFSIASNTLPRRRTPAVSISVYFWPSRSKSR